jgi:hypothetical protein
MSFITSLNSDIFKCIKIIIEDEKKTVTIYDFKWRKTVKTKININKDIMRETFKGM